MTKQNLYRLSLAGMLAVGLTSAVHSQNMSTRAMPMTGTAAQMDRDLRASFDRLFMLKAAQGNMAEVMTSQLALRRSQNPQVRRIAQHMIAEHGAANRELLRLMTQKRMPLPRFVGAMHTATQEHLSRLSGTRFDQMYMAAQVEAHENTVTLFQQELAMGRDRDAVGYARRFLPPILQHTRMVYQVATAVNAPGCAERPRVLARER